MKLPRWIFLGTVYLGELLLIIFIVLLALNLRSVATPATAAAFPLAATTPIRAPTPATQGATKPTGLLLTNTSIVGKNAPANLENKFQVTYVGEFRDRIIFGPTQADWKYAKGVYATIQFRIKNLQTFSDSFAQSYDLVAITADGQTIPSDPAVEANAVWLYCQCDNDRRSIPPGGESVFVITFDVPVSTQSLLIVPTQGSSAAFQSSLTRFSVLNFDKVHPWR
jgi:hypothetical protein